MNKIEKALYFIEKFESIPKKKWTTGKFKESSTGCYCALGHLGIRKKYDTNKDAEMLSNLFYGTYGYHVTAINDGRGANVTRDFRKDLPNNPKDRVLCILYMIASGIPSNKLAY